MPATISLRLLRSAGLAPLLTAAAMAQAGPAPASLDSLLGTRVSAASKYAQRAADAPASVTIITAEEIRLYGFRDLRDALELVRGFYVSDDANYINLGTRGFSRPGDYNNRVLLLLDGHTLNDQTWGGAPIGSELPIRLDAVERIEVVRGPGSALYGTNAMFAVINVVTRTGTEIDGASVSPRVGSHGTRELGVTFGKPIGTHGSYALSGLLTRSDGRDFYFPELDAPATNGGRSSGLDREYAIGGLGAVEWRGLTTRIGYRSREKGIPTGAFATPLNDPRTESVDETFWGSLQVARELGATRRATLRAYADRYRYRGTYPDAVGATPYTDGGGSSDVGVEALYIWDRTSRHRLTLGTEYRNAFRAEYYEGLADGTASSDDSPFSVTSLFAQSELQVSRLANLTVGARYDRQRGTENAVTPRIALVFNGGGPTTAKLLYGEGFRAASSAEAWLSTAYYSRNPSLRSERVRTAEVEVQRRFGDYLLLTGALYRYRMHDLIEQVDEGPAGVIFRNIASVRADGFGLQADLIEAGPFAGRATLAWQDASDESTSAQLTNSPRHLATVMATARVVRGLSVAAVVRSEAKRMTLAGGSTDPFTRTDLNVRYLYAPAAAMLREAVLSLRISNAFDIAWATPGGLEHRQSAIPQSGRAWLLRVDLRF